MAKRFDAPPTDEIAAWEERLKKEGLGSELPPDKAAEALRAESGVEDEGLADKIHKKVQEYWQFRSGTWYGNHKQIAQAVAADLGISEDDVDIDEHYVKAIEEEVGGAQRALLEAKHKLSERGITNARTLRNMLRRKAGEDFPNISEAVLDDIAAKLSGDDYGGEG